MKILSKYRLSDMRSEEIAFNRHLLREIKQRPCLYDYTASEYNVRSVVNNAWDEVSAETGESVENCRSAWRSIRTVVSRHIRQANSDAVTGAKRYYLFDDLKFVLPYLRTGADKKPFEFLSIPEYSNKGDDDDDSMTFEDGIDVKQEAIGFNVNDEENVDIGNDNRQIDHGDHGDDGSGDGTVDFNVNEDTQSGGTEVIATHDHDYDVDANNMVSDPSSSSITLHPTKKRRKMNRRKFKFSHLEYLNPVEMNRKRIGSDSNHLKVMDTKSIESDSKQSVETDSKSIDTDAVPAKKLFLLSLLPDIEEMNQSQMRKFRTECSQLIDRILSNK